MRTSLLTLVCYQPLSLPNAMIACLLKTYYTLLDLCWSFWQNGDFVVSHPELVIRSKTLRYSSHELHEVDASARSPFQRNFIPQSPHWNTSACFIVLRHEQLTSFQTPPYDITNLDGIHKTGDFRHTTYPLSVLQLHRLMISIDVHIHRLSNKMNQRTSPNIRS